jgi:hypothetical protein
MRHLHRMNRLARRTRRNKCDKKHKKRKQVRRRTMKKQYGRGIVDHLEEVTATVEKQFADVYYEIHSGPEPESESESEPTIGVEIYCLAAKSPDDLATTVIGISDDEIYISLLGACSSIGGGRPIRGTEILQRILAIGKELRPIGIQRIRLKDASQLQFPNLSPMRDCTVSLAGYMILTSAAHHSWYNSHGFKSDHYEEEVKANTALAQEPMISLLRSLCAHRINIKRNPVRMLSSIHLSRHQQKNRLKKVELAEEEVDRVVKEMIEIYEGAVSPDQSIQEGIRAIHHIAMQATACNHPKITFYRELMDVALRHRIEYDRHLTLVLS